MRIRNLGILAVFVALLLVVKIVQDRGHVQKNLESDTADILAAADSTDAAPAETTKEEARPMTASDLVNRVTIQFGDDESSRVVLERLDRWVVRSAWGHDADPRKVQELINAMIGLKGEFRSDSPSVLGQYGLGQDASPITVTLHGEDWKALHSLELGNRATDGQGIFVRVPGQNVVYWTVEIILAKAGMFSGPAIPENKFFLALEVQDCEREDVAEIRLFLEDGQDLSMRKVFGEPDSTGVIDYSSWEWELVTPESLPLDRTKVDGILSTLTKVKAADVGDPDGDLRSYGLMKAARRVEYDLINGQTMELRFGAPVPDSGGDAPDVFMMSGLDTTIWVIRSSTADQIFKGLEDLLPTE